MSAAHVTLSSSPSLCQKFLQLVEISQSSDKNNFAQFFESLCIIYYSVNYMKTYENEKCFKIVTNLITPHTLFSPIFLILLMQLEVAPYDLPTPNTLL